jgi:Heterokaryon incompatibility protein (HET)
MDRQPDRNLCLPCSKIDFQALSQHPVKIFRLGTLTSITRNESCPLCLFVLSVVNKLWSQWRDEIWKPNVSQEINFWIKTTLWAHCGDGSDPAVDVPDSPDGATRMDKIRSTYLRYRAALGSDWTPDRKKSYRSPPFTVCELDLFRGTKIFETFPLNQDTDNRQILQRRLIPEMVDVPLLQSWIQQCKTQHGHSGEDDRQAELRKTSRFRVIDVKHRTLVQPQEHIDYIALSYVSGNILHGGTASKHSQWLDSLAECRSDDSMISRPRRIHFERLPATIQDAITLVESIGWKYLWADLICIQQNNDTDKHVLIKSMHLIYEAASFTIVAAGGPNADASLPGWHHARRRPEDVCQINTNNGPLSITLSRPPLADLVSSTAWSTRGWTFQEDLLSPCCLYFTPSEVFYSCRHHARQFKLPSIGDYSGFHTGRYSEWREGYVLETRSIKTAYCAKSGWSNGWSRHPTRSLRSEASVIKNSDGSYQSSSSLNTIPSNVKFIEYAVFVAEYTKRQLSRADDVVAAFMGILGKFGNEQHLDLDVESHGLLETHLELSLLWIAGEDMYLQRRDMLDARRLQLPSWSWTGWTGAVEYPIRHLEESRHVRMSHPQHFEEGINWNFWPGKCLLVYLQTRY